MLKQTYSTKEICQIFDIGRETLRHYEREGLLHPHINPDNGYREYNHWDICLITDILKYRSYGFSLAETKVTLFDQNLDNIINRLEKQAEDYTRLLIRYELLLKKINKDLSYLRRVKEHLGELYEAEMGNILLIPFSTDSSSEYFGSMQTAFKNSLFFTNVITFDYSDHNLDRDGLMTEKGYADFLGIAKGIIIKKSPVVCKTIELVDQKLVNQTTIDNFREEISQKYSKRIDKISAALVSRFYDDEKNFHQYLFLFAKLEQ